MTPPPLPRRTLRSGKEFSAFDLALGLDFEFDIEKCLYEKVKEQEAAGVDHEPEEEVSTSFFSCLSVQDTPDLGPLPPMPSPASSPALSPSLSTMERNKMKSKIRRANKRADAQQAAANPRLKSIHRKRIDESKPTYLEVGYDANGLPHTIPAWIGDRLAEGLPHTVPGWIGDRLAQDNTFDFTEPQIPPQADTGMGGRIYTQAEVDALTGTKGFRYISWLGILTIAILDSRRRVIALLGGTPKDVDGWAKVTQRASTLLHDRIGRLSLTEEQLHHRRADDEYGAVHRGLSHGGGQMQPGELQQNKTNTELTDELMADPAFQRIVGFTNFLFWMWAPKLCGLYQRTREALESWAPHLRWNFVKSVFAACTFNFGPRAITRPHLDFANLAWGWCAITALGSFNPDEGGHLILWDLRLVIRFPPGSSIFIPSAIIRHSNVPIKPHKTRSSFTQYTAGGLFRWVRNGFMTDEDFARTASSAEKLAREAEAATRWEDGMNMFSIIDDL